MEQEQIVGATPGRLAGPIADAVALRALAEPTRFAIYSAVAWGGASTIREVAERTGKRPGSLYRHFEKLTALGVLQVIGEIPTARRPAKVYAAPEDARLLLQPGDDAAVEALNVLVASAGRHAARGFARATLEGRAVARGPQRDTHMATESGWLTPAELDELNRLVERMRELVMGRPRRPGTRLVQLSLFLSPSGPEEPEEPEASAQTSRPRAPRIP